MGRPEKPPEHRRSCVMYLKLTEAEKAQLVAAGQPEPSVWARDTLLRAARRKQA